MARDTNEGYYEAGGGSARFSVSGLTHMEVTNGQLIAISAAASNGYHFVGWEFPDSLNNSRVVLTNQPVTRLVVDEPPTCDILTLWAVFERNAFTLTVTNGSGCKEVKPQGTSSWPVGSIVQVSAEPLPGFAFYQWTGGVDQPTNPVAFVTMNGNKTVTAYFTRMWTVTQKDPAGPGSTEYVSNYVGGAQCVVAPASEFISTAAGFRYRCTGWKDGYGAIPVTSTVLLSYGPFTVNANAGLTWTWVRQFPVTTRVGGAGGGSVAPVAGSYWYDEGVTVTNTAYAADGYKFLRWDTSIGVITTPTLTYTVTHGLDATAVFAKDSPDTDGDGLPDFWELKYQLDANNRDGANGRGGDPDGDGLDNYQELLMSNTNRGFYCNPVNADSDGDGMNDYYEFASVDATNMDTADIASGFIYAATDDGSYRPRNGREGNPDGDCYWNTSDGYMNTNNPLRNWEEYVGPDMIEPVIYTNLNYGDAGYPLSMNPAGLRPTVIKMVKNSSDTGDQSKGNNADSDSDTLDDGFEYTWDSWQRDHAGEPETFSYDERQSSVTNTVPPWAGTNRLFNPGKGFKIPANGAPDFDVLYDYNTGGVSPSWYDSFMEYNCWQDDYLTPERPEAPHTILRTLHPDTARCTHPFKMDVDQDGLPDGYEVIFGTDPWAASTFGGAPDGKLNPDGDWMAYATNALTGVLRHKEVYDYFGFDPRTGWGQLYPGRGNIGSITNLNITGSNAINSRVYSNLDEMRGGDGAIRMTPLGVGTNTLDDATIPYTIDSDSDGMWDGWEFYVGLNPVTNSLPDALPNPDGDGVSNLDEFRSLVTSSSNLTQCLPLPEWMNKIFPTDPNDPDTDADGLSDGAERAAFNQGSSGQVTEFVMTTDILPGGTIVTQGFALARWSGCFVQGGLMPTSCDTDADGLPDPWEANPWEQVLVNGTVDDRHFDPDGDNLENYQEYLTCSVYHWQYVFWTPGLPSYDPADFYYGVPKAWDWSVSMLARPYYYNPKWPGRKLYPYSGCDPSMADTDLDGMDDYYEAFHGLNPLYGVQDMVMSSVWDMPISGGGTGDPRAYPYIAGSPAMDPDGDGLLNDDEGVGLFNGVPVSLYHSDPSPAWCTDPGYPNSWPNLYYQGNDWVWYWDEPDAPADGPPPSSIFDYECNEGYDTDNDGVADYDELVDGQTDLISAESPVKRRALYLPPGKDGYCRTMPTFYNNLVNLYDEYGFAALERFTIEAWVRPLQAATGQRQVILERPFLMPGGNPLDLTAQIRVNFRLAINGNGIPYVEYNGKGGQYVFAEPRVEFMSPLSSNEWTHLAATFAIASATNPLGTLTLYVNGELKASSSGEIPCVGAIGGGDSVVAVGAPIMIGAADNNPAGVINGLAKASDAPQPYDFFHGWIDEVRVWNGDRTQGEIRDGMTHSIKQNGIVLEGSASGTNASRPRLYFDYTFDDLPDPDHSPVSPEGFDIVGSGISPADHPAIGWWGGAPDRSLRYADYRYVPWLQNTVAHLPLVPPLDIGDALATVTNVDGSLRVLYPNTSNPYNFWFKTAYCAFREAHPFGGSQVVFGNDERGDVNLTDLLPLRWAEADEDVMLWDGRVGTDVTFDTDGDGLPDAWETAHGLNANDVTGVNGAYGDPDHDGLSNLYEYFAGTDPLAYDSDGDTLGDFDSYSGTVYRTYGEIYSDMDGVPDDWEYANHLNPERYDGQDDPDADGWSNYAEYMAGTDPQDISSYPNPTIFGQACYYGENTRGRLVVQAYRTATMDDVPVRAIIASNSFVRNATQVIGTGNGVRRVFSGTLLNGNVVAGSVRLTTTPPGNTDFQDTAAGVWSYNGQPVPTAMGADVLFTYASGDFTFTYGTNEAPVAGAEVRVTYQYRVDMPEGSFAIDGLSEGDVYLFAFRDLNNNSAFDVNEPCGTAVEQPVHLGWGDVDGVTIAMFDQAQVPWYHRFAWGNATNGVGESVLVRIYTLGPPKTLLAQKWLQTTRSFWFDQDYRTSQYTTTNSCFYGVPTGYTYQWQVAKDDSGAPSMAIASNTFNYVTMATPVPQPAYPVNGAEVITARDWMRFDMSNTAAGIEVQVGRVGGGWTYTNKFLTPARDQYGRYFQPFPFYFGDGTWSNATYQWRLRSFKPDGTTSAWSVTNTFVVNLRNPPLGMPEVSGDILYFGKASGTNDLTNIVVQAFKANGFGGVASARVAYSYKCDTNNPTFAKVSYRLLGLDRDQYYVRAFVDMNANGTAEAWEPQGFVEDSALRPRMIDLNFVPNGDGLRIILRDRDTDNDGLPDSWEYHYFGTFVYGSNSDPLGSGMTLLQHYIDTRYDSNPTLVDNDGDGLWDGWHDTNGNGVWDPGEEPGEAGDGVHAASSYGTAFMNPDSDGDGVLDGDEILKYHTNPNEPDTDGDGIPDGAEVIAGTDPADPASVLRLLQAQLGALDVNGGAAISLQWDGASGVTYRVQHSPDLREWFDADDGVRSGYGRQSYSEADGMTNRSRFYRVRIVTP